MRPWGYTARRTRGSSGLGPIRHAVDLSAPRRRYRLPAVCGASLVGYGGSSMSREEFVATHPRACAKCVAELERRGGIR